MLHCHHPEVPTRVVMLCKCVQDDLLLMLRNEPGLLSWNVSTLVNRIIATSQILKLPPKLSLTLLTYNRPILNVVPHLPQRLEALRHIMAVTGQGGGHGSNKSGLKETTASATANSRAWSEASCCCCWYHDQETECQYGTYKDLCAVESSTGGG